MKVRNLRNLVSKLPENLTQEEFDELDVMLSLDGEYFDFPKEEESGVIEFGKRCDENGNLIPDDDYPNDMKFFCLVSTTMVAEE